MTASHLLPTNASDFEKSFSLSTDVLTKLGTAADAIARFKSVPNDPLLPFLIWEYGLGEVQPYLLEPRRVIREGLLWQRLRGTPAALRMALGWIGLQPSLEEDGVGDNWATYQLGLPQIADAATVRRVAHLARLSQPARCRLWRIYTDVFDRRPIVLSNGPVLSDGWLSFYSGVPVEGEPGEDVLVSFGARHRAQAQVWQPDPACASFGVITWLGFLAPYLDTFTVGRSALSQHYPRNHGFAMASFFSILWADRQTSGRRWRGLWDARRWLDYTGFDRKLPFWRMGRRALSRAQLVPGWSEGLSDQNSRLGVTFATVIRNPARLGEMGLSEHDHERQTLRLHELHLASTAHEAPPVQPGQPTTAEAHCCSLSSPLRPAERGLSGTYRTLSLRMHANTWAAPHQAFCQEQSTACEALCPVAAPPLGIHGFRALPWAGAWTDAERRWSSTVRLSSQ